MNPQNANRIWFSPAEEPRGVVLLIHGLNLLPVKMDALAKSLNTLGLLVYRPTLQGHDKDGYRNQFLDVNYR